VLQRFDQLFHSGQACLKELGFDWCHLATARVPSGERDVCRLSDSADC
jgi:hypothetical protein